MKILGDREEEPLISYMMSPADSIKICMSFVFLALAVISGNLVLSITSSMYHNCLDDSPCSLAFGWLVSCLNLWPKESLSELDSSMFSCMYTFSPSYSLCILLKAFYASPINLVWLFLLKSITGGADQLISCICFPFFSPEDCLRVSASSLS